MSVRFRRARVRFRTLPPLIAVALLLAGCSLLGGPSPILPLPAPVTPSAPAPAGPTLTLPPITPGPPIAPTPTLIPLSADQRLEVFDQVWTLVRDHYVYTDFRGLDWPAIHDEYTPKVRDAADAAAAYSLIAEMIDRLGDGHSAFSDPQEAAADDALEHGGLQYSGIGVLSQDLGGMVRIVEVIPGSPADHAGLQPFDIVRGVNGKPLTSNADAPRLIRGPAGTPVTLTIESPGRAPREVTIIRNVVNFAYHATASRLPGTNIALLDLPSFDVDGIAAEAGDALQALARSGPLDGCIINLRQNGGGLISEFENTLGLFIDGGNAGYETTRTARAPDPIPGGRTLAALRGKPVVVLVSSLSESAAERFAVTMHDRGRATIVGTTTAGNTETVYYHDLPYGSRLQLAEATYQGPDGESIEDKGLVPDIVVDVAWYSYAPGTDPQIRAAVQHIEGK